MDHFTIFQDFYRVIAEMTEEEIVSAISNGTYRETVEDVRRIFAEQGEKAANEKKIELPEITFSANYRGGRSNATLDDIVRLMAERLNQNYRPKTNYTNNRQNNKRRY